MAERLIHLCNNKSEGPLLRCTGMHPNRKYFSYLFDKVTCIKCLEKLQVQMEAGNYFLEAETYREKIKTIKKQKEYKKSFGELLE